MKLNEYFRINSINLAKFCRDHRLPYATVRNVTLGHECTLSVALQIEKATKKKVKCADLAPTKKRPPSSLLGKFVRSEHSSGVETRKPIESETNQEGESSQNPK